MWDFNQDDVQETKKREKSEVAFTYCASFNSDCIFEGTECPKAKRLMKVMNAEELKRIKSVLW